MMDEASAHTNLTSSAEHDSIYTDNITSEHCLSDGSQCCPFSLPVLWANVDRCRAHPAPFSLLFCDSNLTTGVSAMISKSRCYKNTKTRISIIKCSFRHENKNVKNSESQWVLHQLFDCNLLWKHLWMYRAQTQCNNVFSDFLEDLRSCKWPCSDLLLEKLHYDFCQSLFYIYLFFSLKLVDISGLLRKID